ncbi:MAG: endonuclease III [Clostridia bacterium]|nr:endonuclease III [Clostridia bacterium]
MRAVELKRKARQIVKALEAEYPDASCSLESTDALELLIATRLSAQCTDERVNIVTKELFARYRTMEDYAGADIVEIERIIHSCGLYKTKARDIRAMCALLLEKFGGVIPGSIEELTKLPGVGRKTANLMMGDIFGKPAIVVDTHCIRLSNRLGLVHSTDPYKVELALREIVPPESSSMLCHRFVWHGRAVCRARSPQCAECCLAGMCDYIKTLDKMPQVE